MRKLAFVLALLFVAGALWWTGIFAAGQVACATESDGQLEWTPKQLVFDMPEAGGDPDPKCLYITNWAQTGPVSWTAASSATWLGLQSTSGTISARSGTWIWISPHVAGQEAGVLVGTVTIDVSGAASERVVVPVVVRRPKLDFGNVTVGQSRNLAVRVRNDGQGPLSLAAVRVAADGSASDTAGFHLVGGIVAGQVIEAGAGREVTVAFTPTLASTSGAPDFVRDSFVTTVYDYAATGRPYAASVRTVVRNRGGSGSAECSVTAVSGSRVGSAKTTFVVLRGKSYDLSVGLSVDRSISRMVLSWALPISESFTGTWDNLVHSGTPTIHLIRRPDANLEIVTRGSVDSTSAVGLFGVGVSQSTGGGTTLPTASLSRPILKPTTARRNRYFYLSGTARPSHSSSTAVRLYFWRKVRTKWVKQRAYVNVRIAAGRTSYRVRHKLRYAGYWRVKAYHACASHKAGWSTIRSFRVR